MVLQGELELLGVFATQQHRRAAEDNAFPALSRPAIRGCYVAAAREEASGGKSANTMLAQVESVSQPDFGS
jgi:hypothetical protein